MAHNRLGHAAESKVWHDKAVNAMERALADHVKGTGERLSPNRRLTLKLLRQEAEALILGGPNNPESR
jgi:hypothetical protein